MSMRIQIPIAALGDSAVASCLARLMEALGNANIHDVQTSYVTTPAPHEVKRTPHKNPVVQSGDPEERYQKFLAALPDRSREFLELVKARGLVTIDEAMEALHMTVGKAMGGLTGSIARWAPDYGVTVPFEAVKGPQGRRAWRWIGLDRPPMPPEPVRRRRNPEFDDDVSQDEIDSNVSAAPVAAAPASDDQILDAVLDKLSNSSKRFLNLVCDYSRKGETLTKNKALELFGFSRASALSDVVRPVRDALAEAGLEKCLVTLSSDTGDTSWRWVAPGELSVD